MMSVDEKKFIERQDIPVLSKDADSISGSEEKRVLTEVTEAEVVRVFT